MTLCTTLRFSRPIPSRMSASARYEISSHCNVLSAEAVSSQWLALIPPDMVKATLNLDDEALTHLSKVKPVVVGPSNSTASS